MPPLFFINGGEEMADTAPGQAGSGGRGSSRVPRRRQENLQRWEAVFRRERGPVSLDRRTGDLFRRLILARGSCAFLPAI